MSVVGEPRFLTEFDEPVPALELPGAVTSGGDPVVQLVDGVYRGDDLVGRVTHADGLIGLKVAPPAGTVSVRVVLTMSLDAASLHWWDDRVPEHVRPRHAGGAWLIQVSSQGEIRAATLLTRRRADHGHPTTAVVEFELAVDELEADGLLAIELRSRPDVVPEWACRVVPPYGAVGVRLDRIELLPQTSRAVRRTGRVAGGLVPYRAAEVEARSGLFVANPGPGDPVWSVRTIPRPPERRVRSVRGRPWRFRLRRKTRRLGKELLPAVLWPSARRILAAAGTARRRFVGVPVRRAAASLPASLPASRPPALPKVPTRPRRLARSVAAAVLADMVAWRRIAVRGLDPVTGSEVPLTASYAGAGRFRIRPTGGFDGAVLVGIWPDPALLGLRERLCRRWLGWRVSGTDTGVRTLELDPGDAAANSAAITEVLASDSSGAIRLPVGRYPISGLVIGPGWTIEGDGTTLVQQVATAEPMLHVVGSGVTLRGLRLELPASSPGPHDGAHWTAVTVGRYLYDEEPGWLTGVRLEGITVHRAGRCAANSVTVIGAVSELRISGLDVTGGGTGLMVHWGGVGGSVSSITGPTYHPHDLAIDGVVVRAAFEGFCLSSVHDVVVRDVRCDDVEIGFRLLAGDNSDRFHVLGAGSEVNRRITVAGCEIGWSGDLYAIRVAGWGRSEVDGMVSHRAFDDLQLAGCRIRPMPIGVGDPRPGRRPVVTESAGRIDLAGVVVEWGGVVVEPGGVVVEKSEDFSGLDSEDG